LAEVLSIILALIAGVLLGWVTAGMGLTFFMRLTYGFLNRKKKTIDEMYGTFRYINKTSDENLNGLLEKRREMLLR